MSIIYVINVEIVENAAYITMFCESCLHIHIPKYPVFLLILQTLKRFSLLIATIKIHSSRKRTRARRTIKADFLENEKTLFFIFGKELEFYLLFISFVIFYYSTSLIYRYSFTWNRLHFTRTTDSGTPCIFQR